MRAAALAGLLGAALLACGAPPAGAPAPLVMPAAAAASPAPPEPSYGIRIKSPPIAENGAVVPVTVEFHGFGQRSEYVRELRLYLCHMGFRPIARFRFPQPTLSVATRVKMRKTDQLIAVATLSNGKQLVAAQQTKVIIGSCGGGVPGDFPPLPPDSTVPAVRDHSRTWVRSTLPYNAARLLTGTGVVLPMQAMRADVKIAGFRARVLLQMDFFNPHAGLAEGRFQLRLPDHASPYYVAFGDAVLHRAPAAVAPPGPDAGFAPGELALGRALAPASLKEAVMAPREQARTAYDTITRGRRDPALVEWEGSGVYSVRVFPLQRQSRHRAVIGYDMDLPSAGDGLEFAFPGPAQPGYADVYVYLDADTATRLRRVETVPLSGRPGEGGLLHFQPRGGEMLRLRFAAPARDLLYGVDPRTGPYFAARLNAALPDELAVAGSSHGVFVLDTSALPGGLWFQGQARLLLRLLEDNRDSLRHFAVLFFDVGTHWWHPGFVANTGANRRALARYIAGLSLAGASDLQRALTEAADPVWRDGAAAAPAWDVFLLSDGKASWGDTRPRALLDALRGDRIAKVFAYTSTEHAADMDLLDLITAQHQGAVFRYMHVEAAQLSRAHRLLPWRVVGADAPGAEDAIVAEALRHPYAGQRITVVGRGRPHGPIRLLLESNGRRASVEVDPPGAAVASDLAVRAYGQAAVRHLEDRTVYREAALAFATHFRVTRASASLVMLESEADYRRFGIDSRPDAAARVRGTQLATLPTRPAAPGEETRPLPPALPANQLEELERIGYGISVCRFPRRAAWLMEYAQPLLAHPPVARLRLQLDAADLAQSRLSEQARAHLQAAREAVHRQLAAHGGSTRQPAALRLLSTLLEYDDADADLKVAVAARLQAWSLHNEAYFLLRLIAEADHRPAMLAQLARAAQGQGQLQLAAAIQRLDQAAQGIGPLEEASEER